MKIKIGIILGSDSDFPYIEKGIKLLKDLKIPFSMEVSSAHRTPERTLEIVREFEKNEARVIIAAAGGAAHLPGVVASHTILPVLGVPIKSALNGIDSLYSIVQMPGGIPVATFGIGNSGGINSILFALQVLALDSPKINKMIKQFREDQKKEVLAKSEKLKQRLKS